MAMRCLASLARTFGVLVATLGGLASTHAQETPPPDGFDEKLGAMAEAMVEEAQDPGWGIGELPILPTVNFDNGILGGILVDPDNPGNLGYYINLGAIYQQFGDRAWDRTTGMPRVPNLKAFWRMIMRVLMYHEHLHLCCNDPASSDADEAPDGEPLSCEHLAIDAACSSKACEDVTSLCSSLQQEEDQAKIDELSSQIAALCAYIDDPRRKWNDDPKAREAACACYEDDGQGGHTGYCCPGGSSVAGCPPSLCVPEVPSGSSPPGCGPDSPILPECPACGCAH